MLRDPELVRRKDPRELPKTCFHLTFPKVQNSVPLLGTKFLGVLVFEQIDVRVRSQDAGFAALAKDRITACG
jgi:hypothetical protein